MSTYTQILYHIVFATKNRDPVLVPERREELFRYIWGITKNLNCTLYRINGVEDHLHILVSLHPTVCLSDFVKTVKVASSTWIKEQNLFPQFTHWQDGYGAFTHSLKEKDTLVNYIKNQQEHHRVKPFLEEFQTLLTEAGMTFDERYLP